MSNLGPYQIIDKIAQGAYAEIFRVSKDKDIFALKRLKPHLKYDSERSSVLQTEARLLRLISGDPHFPMIFDQGKIGDDFFIVMELVEGEDLRKDVAQVGSGKSDLSIQDRVKIVWEICRGIEHLHSVKTEEGNTPIHGDLKPANVMWSQKREVKIIDLGLKGGTFDYIPIERLHDKIIGPYSDIYAIGHILFELLHGRALLKAKKELEAYFEMRDLVISEKIFSPDLPEALKKILGKSLKQDSKIRYASVREMRENLENFLTQQK